MVQIEILRAKGTAGEMAIAQEIGHGIEEEGIPYLLVPEAGFAAEEAYRQAQRSSLGVCILVEKSQVHTFTRMLKEKRPLFSAELSYLAQARAVGKNAARIIKHWPFVEWDESDKIEKGKLKG